MIAEFNGNIWEWRGPSPFYFVTVPKAQTEEIKEMSRQLTYGWGMIPVEATIGSTTWKTALWIKDGLYVLPLKDKVRKSEGLDVNQVIGVKLEV